MDDEYGQKVHEITKIKYSSCPESEGTKEGTEIDGIGKRDFY